MINYKSSRFGIAMIELIFAIVIIAISVMTIPSMMNIAAESSKRGSIDDDVVSRLQAQMLDKFQARWGGEYTGVDNNDSTLVFISHLPANDLNCFRQVGAQFFRRNPNSLARCDDNNATTPLAIPATSGSGAGVADGNVSKGLEMLNNGTETLTVTSSAGETYTVSATYGVSYVPANVVTNGTTQTATWTLGSSSAMMPSDGSLGTALVDRTHLKRVVIRMFDPTLNVDTTLTFFKSNIGGGR